MFGPQSMVGVTVLDVHLLYSYGATKYKHVIIAL